MPTRSSAWGKWFHTGITDEAAKMVTVRLHIALLSLKNLGLSGNHGSQLVFIHCNPGQTWTSFGDPNRSGFKGRGVSVSEIPISETALFQVLGRTLTMGMSPKCPDCGSACSYIAQTPGTYSRKPGYQVLTQGHTQFSPTHLPSGIQAQ